jgi:hypothetical protein
MFASSQRFEDHRLLILNHKNDISLVGSEFFDGIEERFDLIKVESNGIL